MPIELLLTAGPTREPIDHVRFLSNRSSGQLGLAVASEAVSRHWNTTLLLGTGGIDPPAALTRCCHPFDTTDDLQSLLGIHAPKCDILIMAAAVADFIPRQNSGQAKLSRHHGPINLTLDPAPDLIAQIATQSRSNQTIVGFALESSDTFQDRCLCSRSCICFGGNHSRAAHANMRGLVLGVRQKMVQYFRTQIPLEKNT